MVHVRDVMTSDVVTVGPDATDGEMVERLLSRDSSGVPVTDADGTQVERWVAEIATELTASDRGAAGSTQAAPSHPT